MDSLLTMEDVKQGTGPMAVRGSVATVHYRGSLLHGPQFANTHDAEPLRIRIGDHEVIAGLEWGILGMRVGGQRHLVISPEDRADPLLHRTVAQQPGGKPGSMERRRSVSKTLGGCAPMPKWLQGMTAPTLTLWFCVVALGIASAGSPNDGESPPRADLVSRLAFALVMASWVVADARKRGRRLCYDFESFVFFIWPIVIPVYLFQTRGVRAFLTVLCFAGICVVAMLAAAVVFIIREFAS